MSFQYFSNKAKIGDRSIDVLIIMLKTALFDYRSIVNYDTSTNEEKITIVVPVTSVEVEVAGSKAMLALSFSTLSLKCLMK